MEEVILFCFDYKINELTYEGHIPALSWEDAQDKVSKFGAVVSGKSIQTQCARCGLKDDNRTPESVDYDFPDLIGD